MADPKIEEPWEPDVPFYKATPVRPVAPAETRTALVQTADGLTRRISTPLEVKELIEQATQDFIELPDDADSLTVRRLTVRIQRLRIAHAILSDDQESLTKEMGVLNRVMAGKALDAGEEGEQDESERDQVLKDRGIGDPTSAARVLRTLEAVMGKGNTTHAADHPARDAVR